MSDDLVKRLRGFPPNVHETMTEAADRIAELEAALEEVRPLVIGASHSEARYPKARAALEGGKS